MRPYTVDWESVCTDAYRVRSFPVGALHATPHREMGICVLYGRNAMRPYTVDWESVCTDAYRVRSFPVGALHATPPQGSGYLCFVRTQRDASVYR